MKDIPLLEDIEANILESVIVLLVTRNEIEMLAAKSYLNPIDSTGNIYNFKPKEDQTQSIVYYIGKYGSCSAAVRHLPPALEVQTNTSNVSKFACKWFPNLNAVIILGITYGIERKVKVCDILVSSDVVCDDEMSTKLEKDPSEETSLLLKLFTQSPSIQWSNDKIAKRLKDSGIQIPNIECGIILSESYSIPKELLIKSVAPKAIDIEVEESHLFTETKKIIENTIIVKAVCDYADAQNNKTYKPTAALLAADFAYGYLTNPRIHEIFAGL